MRSTKIQWVAAAVIILSILGILASVLITNSRIGNDSMDIALPDGSALSPFPDGVDWPIEEGSGGSPVTLTRENVRTVVALLSRPSQYYVKVNTTVYSGGESRVVNAEQWVLSDKTVTRRSEEGESALNLIRADGTVSIWRDGDSAAYICAEGSFGDDDELRVPTYEDALDKDAEIIAAEYREDGDRFCVYVETREPLTGFRDRYYIDVDSGLLCRCESYDGDELCYYMYLEDWSEDIAGSEALTAPQ